MIESHRVLAARLGVCSATLTKWRLKNYFGDVPMVGYPPTCQYDVRAVKAVVEARKLRVVVNAFDDLTDG